MPNCSSCQPDIIFRNWTSLLPQIVFDLTISMGDVVVTGEDNAVGDEFVNPLKILLGFLQISVLHSIVPQ